jgi:ABC-type transporter Mla subunit MlaD
MGIPVGRVTDMWITPQNRVHVETAIDDESVTLRKGVQAELAVASIATGSLNVSLEGGDPSSPKLPPNSQIPAKRSLIEAVSNYADEMLNDLRSIISQVDLGLKGMEEGDISAVVVRAEEVLEEGRRVLSEAETTVRDVRPRVNESLESLDRTIDSINQFVEEAETMLQTAREAIAKAEEKITPLDLGRTETAFRESLESVTAEIEAASKQFEEASEILLHQTDNMEYDLREATEQLSGALESVEELADYLKQNPSSLIRGRGKPGRTD